MNPQCVVGFVVAACALVATSTFAQGSVAGRIRSPTGTGVAGVTIQLDGDSVSVTPATGDFAIRVSRPGSHTLFFSHPRFRPVMSGIEYRVVVDTDTTPTALTVNWPDLGELVERACLGSTSPQGVGVIGSVYPPPRGPQDTVDVVAGWEGTISLSGRRFGGIAARVKPDGSYLLCGLPPTRQVGLFVRRGLAIGATRALATPPKGFVELILQTPPL